MLLLEPMYTSAVTPSSPSTRWAARWERRRSRRPPRAITWPLMSARDQFGVELTWGIEDCRNMSALLERDLLGAGQVVVRVPTKLMAQTRKSGRARGKSDPIDAESVARAVLREPDLPVASHDEISRE